MDTEQTAAVPVTPVATRSVARRWIRTATISLNLLTAVVALTVSAIGVALTLGLPDVHLPNDESEISGIFSVIAISGFIGLFYALPVILGINILNWVLTALGRATARRGSSKTVEARTEVPDLPHT